MVAAAAAALCIGWWFLPAEERQQVQVRLQNLRLNTEGKLQVDIIAGGAVGSGASALDVELHDGERSEMIQVVGLRSPTARRTATMTRPLPCNEQRSVMARLVTAAGDSPPFRAILQRPCGAPVAAGHP